MPNHVENDLSVYGPLKDIRKLVALAEQGDSLFSFNSVLPYPSYFRERDEAVERMGKENQLALSEGKPAPHSVVPNDGYNSGGYEWCRDNWGTKWDAYSITRDWTPEDYENAAHNEDATVNYSFQTAWSPPNKVITAYSLRFPSLKFEMLSYEQGMAFMQVFHIQAGSVIHMHRFPYHGNRGG